MQFVPLAMLFGCIIFTGCAFASTGQVIQVAIILQLPVCLCADAKSVVCISNKRKWVLRQVDTGLNWRRAHCFWWFFSEKNQKVQRTNLFHFQCLTKNKTLNFHNDTALGAFCGSIKSQWKQVWAQKLLMICLFPISKQRTADCKTQTWKHCNDPRSLVF